MFHIDMTFEDTRIIATSSDGKEYGVTCSDNLTRKNWGKTLTAKQLGYIFAFMMDSDGEPEGFEQMYVELEPLLVNCPLECRPIP